MARPRRRHCTSHASVPPARCTWATSELAVAYHDQEWGVPVYDDRVLFEFLILEGAQAGLSWETVLKRRASYQEAFSEFDPQAVALYTRRHIYDMMRNPGLIRHSGKIWSAIGNAKAFLRIQEEFDSFSRYVWRWVGGQPQRGLPQGRRTRSPESDQLSADLKKRGFTFVGTTICYAYMQAMGLVNDHELTCFRRDQV